LYEASALLTLLAWLTACLELASSSFQWAFQPLSSSVLLFAWLPDPPPPLLL
jgi:hypothetical protein